MESIESMEPPVHPDEARAALREAVAAKEQLVRDLRLPRSYSLITGAGNAALVFGVALGNSEWRFGSLAFVLGLLLQTAALGAAVRLFKQLNGAWITGFSGPRSTWPVAAAALALLVSLIVVSTWLMVERHHVASALVALCALPLTAVGDRWWMARFRAAL